MFIQEAYYGGIVYKWSKCARMIWISSSSVVIVDEKSLSTEITAGFFIFFVGFSCIKGTSGLLQKIGIPVYAAAAHFMNPYAQRISAVPWIQDDGKSSGRLKDR